MEHEWAGEIESVRKLIKVVEGQCNNRNVLFRGQPEDKPLLPSIGRGTLTAQFLEAEQRLLKEFKIRSAPYLPTEKRTDFEWLAIAQHHGMATRLLDWTANPLAALWFAVRESSEEEKDGVIWLFPFSEDDIADQDHESPFELGRTKVFQPRHITKTFVAQSGWFTVHKYMEEKSKFIALEDNKRYKGDCDKFRIPRIKFGDLSRQLDRLGINDATMFPELRGLCEYLNWVHLPNLIVRRFPRLRDETIVVRGAS